MVLPWCYHGSSIAYNWKPQNASIVAAGTLTKKMGPAYDTVNDRFFTTQCGTCPNIMCYACKFELEDPFDMCTFEVDTCVTCNSKFRTTAKKRNNICINFFVLNHSGKCCELASQHWRKWKAKENFSKNELVEEIDHESFFEWDEKLPESWSH